MHQIHSYEPDFQFEFLLLIPILTPQTTTTTNR
jgi:hypothetical protein